MNVKSYKNNVLASNEKSRVMKVQSKPWQKTTKKRFKNKRLKTKYSSNSSNKSDKTMKMKFFACMIWFPIFKNEKTCRKMSQNLKFLHITTDKSRRLHTILNHKKTLLNLKMRKQPLLISKNIKKQKGSYKKL